MKCNNVERLIYLYKPGELGREEEQKLHQHLKQCPECKKLYDSVMLDADSFEKEHIVEPDLSFPEILTNKIMTDILKDSKQITLNRVFGFLFRNKYQTALVVVIVFLLGWFGTQQISIHNKLDRLENKISEKIIRKDISSSHSRVKTNLFMEVKNNGFSLNHSELELIKLYMDLKKDQEKLYEILEKNPEIFDVLSSEKDKRELLRLMQEFNPENINMHNF